MTKLTGTVFVHGEPVKGGVVELHNSRGDIVDQVQVDDQGRYTYHLSPGKWSVQVWDAWGHTGNGEITLEEGDEKSLDVTLQEPEGGH